jgi:transmembrane sensor
MMNNDNPEQNNIDHEAAAWVARLNSGSVTGEDRQHFNAWVVQSPAHRQAFFAMRNHWQNLGQAAQQSPTSIPQRTKSGKHWMMAAASVLLVVSLSLGYPRLQDAVLADVMTTTGERKTLSLEDGSTLHLNTETAVAIDFNPQQRTIRLLHGEAEVIVAHDPSRPLVIVSGHHESRALGTDFSVARIGETCTVTVFESIVQVSEHNNVIGLLKPGEQLQISDDSPQAIKTAVNLKEANAWRDGKLAFTARPLHSVIAEINRYRPGHLFLLNNKAANRPVSGVFDIAKLDESLVVIADILELRPVQMNGYVLALY